MPYGDAIRVLGTIAVVVGHVCDLVVFNPESKTADWWFCNFADAATRWAVPAYIMLSGSLLLDPARSETPKEFYSKRLARLGIPIIFWSAFYMWFTINVTQWDTKETVWNNLFLGKPYMHLHFIFRIAGLYAFTPMIRVFLQHAQRRMVVLAVLIMLALATADSMINAWTGSELSAFLRFTPFMGYYLLGYYLRDRKLTRRSVVACCLLAASCILLLAGGTGLLVGSFGLRMYPSISFVLYDFMSPVRITLAVCAWLILTNTFDQKWFESSLGRFVTKWLAPTTLGLYLIHPVFRELLYMHGYTPTWITPWIAVPVLSIGIYVVSAVSVFVLMRIPVLKRIVI